MIHKNYINSVREEFSHLLKNDLFQTDKHGGRVLEIRSATFIADERAIFGEVNDEYVKRELEWYESQSLSINDFPGGPPEIWKQVACRNGRVNSNYGYRVWSEDEGNQYKHVKTELTDHPDSRRAVMIYTNPWMWEQYAFNDRSDFICTNAVQYFNRYDTLSADVQMRSNDAVLGYKNDRAWQKHVLNLLAGDLHLTPGALNWHAGSLHVYERHFYLVHHYGKTGDHNIGKKRYRELYPNSEWMDDDTGRPVDAPVHGNGKTGVDLEQRPID